MTRPEVSVGDKPQLFFHLFFEAKSLAKLELTYMTGLPRSAQGIACLCLLRAGITTGPPIPCSMYVGSWGLMVFLMFVWQAFLPLSHPSSPLWHSNFTYKTDVASGRGWLTPLYNI